MNAKLVVVSGETQSSEYPLALPAIIGRSRQANLTLGHPLVSRKHCELFETAGVLMVRDLGSLNGTFVGQTRINDEAALATGGLLTVGPVTFQAVYEQTGVIPGGGVPADASSNPAFSAAATQEIQPAPADALSTGEETPPRAASATVVRDNGKDEPTVRAERKTQPGPPPRPADAKLMAPSADEAATEPFSLPATSDSSATMNDDFELLDFESPAAAPAQPAANPTANGATDSDDDFELASGNPEPGGSPKKPDDDELDDFFKSLGMN